MQSKSKLKIGLIGYGFIGKTHAPNIINNPNATLHSIFSAPEDKDSIPTGVKFFDDWKALIDDPDVDAVVIVTPTFTHREIAIYAAQKKKHIFLEKPMARTTKECQDIIDACKAEGVKLFIGHVLRFWPSYVQAKTMMKNVDTFGTLKNSRLRRISARPAWAKWFFNQELSGGAMLDLAIHDLDFTAYAFNEYPEKVYCEAQKSEVDGQSFYALACVTMSFPSGGIAYVEGSWLGTEKFPFYTEAEFIGTEGIIQFKGGEILPIQSYTNTETIIADPIVEDGYYIEMNEFVNCILQNTEPSVSGEAGKMAVAIGIAAEKSADSGQPVMLKEVL